LINILKEIPIFSVHKINYFSLLFFIAAFVQTGKAQLLDDSTKLVYGPETSRYYYEADILNNTGKNHSIDTLLTNLHHITQVNRFNNRMQDLGNLGTAARPLFYAPPAIIGLSSGYNSFDVFFKDPSRIKYYDTRSPYTQLYHVLGGGGRTITEVDYSRNINPQWNIGGNFHRIITDKQFGAQRSRGDRHTESNAYYFYTGFKTKDEKYHILGHFSRMNHEVRENGGVNAQGQAIFETTSPIFLRNVQSSELKTNYHLYQQYKFSERLQLYHTLDRTKQDVAFKANFNNTNEINYFNNIFISEDSTRDRSNFKTFANQVGIKGQLDRLFYNTYLKRRDLKFNNAYFEPLGYNSENYFGSNLRYSIKTDLSGEIFGEFMIGGNYMTGMKVEGKNLKINYTRSKYSPSYLHQSFIGNHHRWDNDFTPILSDHLNLSYTINASILSIRPNFALTNIDNHVYFNSNQRPGQANGDVQIISPGLDVNLLFLKRIHWESSLTLSRVYGSASNTYRLPEIFANSKVYYSNFLFAKNLQMQAGFDIHGRSSYNAMSYSTSLQQFYLQNQITLPSFITVDLFANMKISKFLIFFKLVNLNQGLPDAGYFLTPNHPGQGRTLDFGINWLFFD
jgi:hypothetical protein